MQASSFFKTHRTLRQILCSLILFMMLVAFSVAPRSVNVASLKENEPQTTQAVFSNPGAITINDAGIASPYPSIINVSGLDGNIPNTPGSVKVTLCNFSHTFSNDVGIVLVGPTGAALLLQDGAGDNPDMVNVTYTLSDTGATTLPDVTAWTAGVYKPTGYYAGDNFPASGPGTSYGHPGPAGGGTATFSSTFGGTNPNGMWKLYVVDFVSADAGSIGCGWTLEISSPVTSSGGMGAYTAYLNAPQEVPANPSTARGRACIALDEAAHMISFTVTFNGLTSAQTVAHIHSPAPVGVNAGVTINLGTVGGTSGVISGTASVTPTFIGHMRSGRAYVDIHTQNFPGGEIRGQIALKRPVDYDADGRMDLSVLRSPNVPAPGVSQITYWNLNSFDDSITSREFGNANTDFPAPGDYDGDCRCDLALYRSGQNTGDDNFYLVLRSTDSNLLVVRWGVKGDESVARDYDGDGITDMAVFRRGANAGDPAFWYIRQSAFNNMQHTVQWGTTGDAHTGTGDTPVPGDYDGDGKFDLAVYRDGLTPANTFIILRSSDSNAQFAQWGAHMTDYILPGDFDGDGKFDFVAARTGAGSSPMDWYILRSSDGGMSFFSFGISTDLPVQGDYDGDGRADVAVYRPGATATSVSMFFYLSSFDNQLKPGIWGLRGDFPVANFDTH